MPDPKPPTVSPREDTKGEIGEFVDMTKRYVIQETVGPLKTIGRTLAFGSAAAIMFGFASLFALVGVLRVLQTDTGARFTGSLTWLPYLITIVAGLVILGLAAAIVLRGAKTPPPRPSSEIS